MLAGHGRGGTYGAAAAVVVTSGLLGVAVVLQQIAVDPPAAVLTVYEGTASVATAASHNLRHGVSGDGLQAGDTVKTGPKTKASISYPSASQVRLDSNTELRLDKVSRGVGGAFKADAYQSIGKTWSRLSSLAGGSTYTIHAPNSSTAEVRGTEFEVIVEVVDGRTIVRINVFTGVVAATAAGVTVVLTAGQSTTIGPDGSPPLPPQPISPADLEDSFTVFNQTLDRSAGVPVTLDSGSFTPPQSTGLLDGPTADGSSDLQFTLGWPGSRFELAVYEPDGALYETLASGAPPVSITVYRATAGLWKYQVSDLESRLGESWWVIISKISPSQQAAASPSPSGSTPPATNPTGPPSRGQIAPASPPPPGGTTSTPSPSPVPAPPSPPHPSPSVSPPPSPDPSPSPSPSASPPPSPDPSPSPSPNPPSPSASPPPSPDPSPSPSPNPPSPSPSASPSPSPPPPPPSPSPSSPGVDIRGDGSIAAGAPDPAAFCQSAPGTGVAFHVHTSGAAGDADGSVEVGFASAGSCTSGQPSGPRTYDVTSKAVRHVDQDPSGAGVDRVVVTFANLNVTDETTPGEGGAIVVECSNFTLRVTVVEAGTGPRSAQVEFQILDGAGKLWWSSGGLQPLSTGSLAIG